MINFQESYQSLKAFMSSNAKKAFIVWGMVILCAITLLSCVSSFMIYKEGFKDFPFILQCALAIFAVLVVEGAFLWLVYGYTNVLSSRRERFLAFGGMWALAAIMLLNIVTHFMMVKGAPLNSLQEGWLAWGAVSIFIGILVLVLAIRLSDPIIRMISLHLRFLGKQEEVILQAKEDALRSDMIREAMAERAIAEARLLANRIMYEGLPEATQYHLSPAEERLETERNMERYERLSNQHRGGLLNGTSSPND